MTLPTEFVEYIAELLERLAIPYQVGGSVASSTHGMYRASADIDVVIDPTAAQLESLALALEGDFFYVSRTAMAEALADRSTFNAIHETTSFKLDFFIKGGTPFDAEELRRSVMRRVGGAEGRDVRFKSAEDTVLRKLEWYRRGGEISERQWNDVLAVLAAARHTLDGEYLDRWADALQIRDLLARARAAAGGR